MLNNLNSGAFVNNNNNKSYQSLRLYESGDNGFLLSGARKSFFITLYANKRAYLLISRCMLENKPIAV